MALSALAPDSFAKLANRTKYLNSLIQENYISKVGDKPWVAFDMGAKRKVIFFIIFKTYRYQIKDEWPDK